MVLLENANQQVLSFHEAQGQATMQIPSSWWLIMLRTQKNVWFGVTEVTWRQMKGKLRITNSSQKALADLQRNVYMILSSALCA
jgi:hypothetical protein